MLIKAGNMPEVLGGSRLPALQTMCQAFQVLLSISDIQQAVKMENGLDNS